MKTLLAVTCDRDVRTALDRLPADIPVRCCLSIGHAQIEQMTQPVDAFVLAYGPDVLRSLTADDFHRPDSPPVPGLVLHPPDSWYRVNWELLLNLGVDALQIPTDVEWLRNRLGAAANDVL